MHEQIENINKDIEIIKKQPSRNYGMKNNLKISLEGCRVAQLVKHRTLDFRSGYDLAVCDIEPHFRLCTYCLEFGIVSLLLSLPLLCLLSFSQNKF